MLLFLFQISRPLRSERGKTVRTFDLPHRRALAMKYTDIAIIGGGLAGSTAAAMLGRAGIAAILVDPHAVYPPDFRIEKLQRRRAGRALPQDRNCR